MRMYQILGSLQTCVDSPIIVEEFAHNELSNITRDGTIGLLPHLVRDTDTSSYCRQIYRSNKYNFF